MDSENGAVLPSTAPGQPAMADEKAHLEHEKYQLGGKAPVHAKVVLERNAFDRERETEWATINHEKEELNKQRGENAQLKQRLMFGISEYFWKKAELESGLVPASEAPDDNPQPLLPLRQPGPDTSRQTLNPLPKRKRDLPGLDGQPAPRATNGKDDFIGVHSPSTMSPAQLAHSEEEGNQLEPVPKKKRGRPRLHEEAKPGRADEQETSVKTTSGPAQKRGRPKLYHHTEYGTMLPLTYLLPSGAVLNAEQARTRRPAHWEYVIRFIKDRQVAAKFAVRAWLEKKSKDCMMCFVDLKTKSELRETSGM
ncbi:hypothetical protein SLS58_010051 [Diplodia intermedia]|uniref:Uncharacterized protein n=1 Tax=Diplodia intermedia TaxID=856260 RepID=A0ABR3T929_9PEZI